MEEPVVKIAEAKTHEILADLLVRKWKQMDDKEEGIIRLFSLELPLSVVFLDLCFVISPFFLRDYSVGRWNSRQWLGCTDTIQFESLYEVNKRLLLYFLQVLVPAVFWDFRIFCNIVPQVIRSVVNLYVMDALS